jgi:hypothetical protein
MQAAAFRGPESNRATEAQSAVPGGAGRILPEAPDPAPAFLRSFGGSLRFADWCIGTVADQNLCGHVSTVIDGESSRSAPEARQRRVPQAAPVTLAARREVDDRSRERIAHRVSVWPENDAISAERLPGVLKGVAQDSDRLGIERTESGARLHRQD